MPDPGRTPSLPQLEPVDRAPVPAGPDARRRGLAFKHALDRVGAATAILLALPLLLVAALVVKLSSSGPVLVRERRIARDGRSFQMLMFPVLPILRRWSIDQLPQLLNVLRGQMSFVGPRPERPEFVELFGANLRRHDGPRRVRPGIAGWSQLQGLSGRAPLAERVRWDDWYVENWSLWLDVKIVLMTVRDVCRGAHLASAD
jgi:lipopolysaccharide/colanic/teichoic acid biosynthesis glycosyltransferase